MFELADLLIGIYKTFDCTNTVAINPRAMCMPLQELDTNSRSAASQQNTQAMEIAGLLQSQATTAAVTT